MIDNVRSTATDYLLTVIVIRLLVTLYSEMRSGEKSMSDWTKPSRYLTPIQKVETIFYRPAILLPSEWSKCLFVLLLVWKQIFILREKIKSTSYCSHAWRGRV